MYVNAQDSRHKHAGRSIYRNVRDVGKKTYLTGRVTEFALQMIAVVSSTIKKKNSPRLSNLTTMDARHLKAKYIYLLTPQLCVAFKKFKWALEWYRLPSKMPTVARDSFSDILTVPPADGQPADARSYRAWFLKWDQEKKKQGNKTRKKCNSKTRTTLHDNNSRITATGNDNANNYA